MKFDIIIIGGGHAGVEAANIASTLSVNTALVTLDKNKIAEMSCNPSIGGLAKGHLVKEIDALGGVMAKFADKTAIQYRILNRSKGPAVRGTRVQSDRHKYRREVSSFLENKSNLSIIEGEVLKLSKDKDLFIVEGNFGEYSKLESSKVIICTGTFLNGILHFGFKKEKGGRTGEKSADFLTSSLLSFGHQTIRLKTGTPARVEKQSLDISKMETQYGDEEIIPFSLFTKHSDIPFLEQVPCYTTFTSPETHRIIAQAIKENMSPLYSGAIKGIGPRYCPSIEDKIKKFPERERHQIFVEPESLETNEIYINGVSSSLPEEIQDKFIRAIPGLENVKFIKYGYAVEYDAFDPRDLTRNLESKKVSGLYIAGQVNGTSGYEEAAAQGLAAGLSAALSIKNIEWCGFDRYTGYIGVMIEDLITKGVDEPYRMFTSRAEHRLLFREDNAWLRYKEISEKFVLLDKESKTYIDEYNDKYLSLQTVLKSKFIFPNSETIENLKSLELPIVSKQKTSYWDYLKRPEIDTNSLKCIAKYFEISDEDYLVFEQLETDSKYEGYIAKQLQELKAIKDVWKHSIPSDLDYKLIPGISREIAEKLSRIKPTSESEMKSVPGITPAAIGLIHAFIHKKDSKKDKKKNDNI